MRRGRRVVPKSHAYPAGRCTVATPGNEVGRTRRRSGAVPCRPSRTARGGCGRVRRTRGQGPLPQRHPQGSGERPWPADSSHPRRLRPRLRRGRPGVGGARGEGRWRRVANEICGDPGLPVRPAGASPAAVAGARAGVGVAPPDVYDPERIKAALRGGSQRSDRAAQRTGTPGATASAVRDSGSGGTGWSFADAGSTGWNSTDAAPGWGATAWDATTAPPAGWDTTDASPGFGATDGAAAGWGATDFPAAGRTATDSPVNGWSATDAAPANGWSATEAPADGWSPTDAAANGWSATNAAPADGV